MDKEVEQFVTALQVLVHDIDSILSAYGVPNYRASAAIANIRDTTSQLASNPREPIQMHNCIQRIVEQLLCAYRNADFQQHQLCMFGCSFIFVITVCSVHVSSNNL